MPKMAIRKAGLAAAALFLISLQSLYASRAKPTTRQLFKTQDTSGDPLGIPALDW